MTPAEFERLRERAELLHNADLLSVKLAKCIAEAAARAVTAGETIDAARAAIAMQFPTATREQVAEGAALALAIFETYEERSTNAIR